MLRRTMLCLGQLWAYLVGTLLWAEGTLRRLDGTVRCCCSKRTIGGRIARRERVLVAVARLIYEEVFL
jgi:hypothetical protein